MAMVVHVNDIPNLPPKVREMCEKRGITNMLVLAAQNAWEMRKYDISEEDIQWVFGLKEEVVRTHKHIPEVGSGFSTPNSHLVFCDTRRHKLEKVGFFEARAWYKEVAIKIANCEDGWRWGYDFYGGANPSYFTNPLKSRRECLKEGCKFLLERAEEQLSYRESQRLVVRGILGIVWCSYCSTVESLKDVGRGMLKHPIITILMVAIYISMLVTMMEAREERDSYGYKNYRLQQENEQLKIGLK